MAEKRTIATSFWGDQYIEELTPTEKLLYLYLLTNRATLLCGLYECTERAMAYETGLPISDIREALKRFTADGKIIFDGGLVYVVNYARHQNGERCRRIRQHVVNTAKKYRRSDNKAYEAFVLAYAEILGDNQPESANPSVSVGEVFGKGNVSLTKDLRKGYQTLQEKDKEQDKDIVYTENVYTEIRGEYEGGGESQAAYGAPETLDSSRRLQASNGGPSLDAVLSYARMHQEFDIEDATDFFHHYNGQGWRTGGDHSTSIRTGWQSKLILWCRRENRKRQERGGKGQVVMNGKVRVIDGYAVDENGVPLHL